MEPVVTALRNDVFQLLNLVTCGNGANSSLPNSFFSELILHLGDLMPSLAMNDEIPSELVVLQWVSSFAHGFSPAVKRWDVHERSSNRARAVSSLQDCGDRRGPSPSNSLETELANRRRLCLNHRPTPAIFNLLSFSSSNLRRNILASNCERSRSEVIR